VAYQKLEMENHKKWYWNEVHQQAFDGVNATTSKDEELKMFTDGSKKQLGAVINQQGGSLALFIQKLTKCQQKYSITEIKLLAIVKCLTEIKGMLWGQQVKVHPDHKNLMQDALGLTSDRVYLYHWRLVIEEYSP
jgi:glutaredoxin 2